MINKQVLSQLLLQHSRLSTAINASCTFLADVRGEFTGRLHPSKPWLQARTQPQVILWLPLSLMVVHFVPTILPHCHTLTMLPGCPPDLQPQPKPLQGRFCRGGHGSHPLTILHRCRRHGRQKAFKTEVKVVFLLRAFAFSCQGPLKVLWSSKCRQFLSSNVLNTLLCPGFYNTQQISYWDLALSPLTGHH